MVDAYSYVDYTKNILPYVFLLVCADALVISQPIEYYQNNNRVYTAGTAVYLTYVFGLSLILGTLFVVFKYRKQINRYRRNAVLHWMIIWMVGAVTQYRFNDYLLVSFASTVGIILMFFALENPESNLDRQFGCFHSHVLNEYVVQKMKLRETFSILYINLAEHYSDSDSEKINYEIQRLIDNLNLNRNARVFKMLSKDLIAIYPSTESMRRAYQGIKEKFFGNAVDEPREVLSAMQVDYNFPTALMITMDDGRLAGSMEALRGAISMLRMENKDITVPTHREITEDTLERLHADEVICEEIKRAMDEDRVEVFYQPIYSTAEDCFVSAEALVRIRQKDGSILPPGKFIPVAEKTGIIITLGERVFEKTCAFLGTGVPQDLGIQYIEVNLSVVQFEQKDLADKYIRIMEKYRISPSLINLEITETASIQSKRGLQNNMERLMRYGVDFSLDDFGNGHSNLNYVIDMPVELVKLDMSLIQAYEKEQKARAVVQGTVDMIQRMDMHTVTEGVETREQLEEMRRLGVNYIQGFYFSKPLSEQEFVEFLKKNQKNRTVVTP
jgi:EAL domain-containing protein (putative c-di-GMP-specific phosphodiesterase class I)